MRILGLNGMAGGWHRIELDGGFEEFTAIVHWSILSYIISPVYEQPPLVGKQYPSSSENNNLGTETTSEHMWACKIEVNIGPFLEAQCALRRYLSASISLAHCSEFGQRHCHGIYPLQRGKVRMATNHLVLGFPSTPASVLIVSSYVTV